MRTITNSFETPPALFFWFLYFLCGCTKEVIVNDLGYAYKYEPKKIASGVMLGNVYVTNNFASFTDITHYNNSWYVIFRAGTEHIGGVNGEIKILKSNDAITWTIQHIIENDTLDLRDPKFVIDSINNHFYLNFTGVNYESSISRMYGFIASYNPTTEHWNNPQFIAYHDTTGQQFVFWRLTYTKSKMYSASFRSPNLGGYATDNICLFSNNSNDFKTYASIGRPKIGNSPNEATVRFDNNDNMYLLVRRETADVALGFSTPSNYSNVKWIENTLSTKLSSPNFLFYNNNKLLICGRDQSDLQFKFFSYNIATNKVEKKYTFPSGGETGYGGMSFNPANKDELLISYYVISNDISYIKLIRIDLKAFLQ
jgi:hypothetical protein